MAEPTALDRVPAGVRQRLRQRAVAEVGTWHSRPVAWDVQARLVARRICELAELDALALRPPA